MASTLTFPQEYPVIRGLEPQAGAAVTGDYISLKNAHCVHMVFFVTQANAAQMVMSVRESPLVSGVGSQVLAATFPIWANETCATTDAMVRQANAANFTLAITQLHKIVVFKIEASILTATFDCVAPVTAASDATNITACLMFLQPRFAQATPPSAIID